MVNIKNMLKFSLFEIIIKIIDTFMHTNGILKNSAYFNKDEYNLDQSEYF